MAASKIALLSALSTLLVVSCASQVTDTRSNPTASKLVSDSSAATPEQQGGLTTSEVTQAYSAAIAEYIKAVYTNKPAPDTLFIGRHPDFPDIILPATIRKVNILQLTSDEAREKLGYRKSLVYLNVMGWPAREESEFLIVTFFEFRPQYNCIIKLKHNSNGVARALASLHFDYPYGSK